MSNRQRVLLVDDEQDFARGLARLVKRLFPKVHVDAVFSAKEALEYLRSNHVEVLMTDLRMPQMSGMELMPKVHEIDPDVSIVVLTAHGTIETAVEALQAGAYDFVTKPVEPAQLKRVLQKGLERMQLLGENRRLRDLVALKDQSTELVGESPVMQTLRHTISTVATSDYTVLIRGESGTGKEMVARLVHRLSARNKEAFLTVNCPAIPEHLLESELFGHTRGAFTGADRERKGLFTIADGGTVLLDEIGDIPLQIQTKLLRFLQEGEVRPVGSSRNDLVDVRVVASTNRDLEASMLQKEFREDLFYRLNVVTLWVPPLRERVEDIPLLATAFLARTCDELGTGHLTYASGVLDYLTERVWHGNVRELQNYVRRLALFSTGGEVGFSAVQVAEQNHGASQGFSQNVGNIAPSFVGVARENPIAPDTSDLGLLPLENHGSLMPYKDAKNELLEVFTEKYLRQLLQTTGGNVSEAARLSGLSRVSIQKMLLRYDINAAAIRSTS